MKNLAESILGLILIILPVGFSQRLVPQTDTFNSNYTLTASQSRDAGLNALLANNAAVALNFERSNWAIGSVSADPFYQVPNNFSPTTTKPGSLLKLELLTNTTFYTLPPNTALSRFLFATETLNGTTVPASAYILWPFSPNLQPGSSRAQVVGFGHGFSGEFGDCAPSHLRTLSYEFQAPYTLALNGYVVVAPDFAGLGVNYTYTADGTKKSIRHAIEANPAAANDLFYAVEAAQAAFPTQMSKEFVIMGHSEGGGAAWGAAQRQATRPVAGYLGTVAASPLTNVSAQVAIYEAAGITAISGAATQAWGMLDIFPDFQLSDILTPLGVKRTQLMADLGGCNSVTEVLLAESDLFQKNWWETYYVKSFFNLTTNGGKPISGPMLVVQGTADPAVPEPTTSLAVNETCRLFPASEIEYLLVNGTTHVPTLYAAQKQWLAWIKDRFAGVSIQSGCTRSALSSYMPLSAYQPEVNWFMEWATSAYELA